MQKTKEKYKKFMFNRRFDQTQGEIDLAQSEIQEALNLSEETEQQELEKIITADITAEPVPEEPLYIPPTFTQEQLDMENEKSYQRGLAGREKAGRGKHSQSPGNGIGSR